MRAAMGVSTHQPNAPMPRSGLVHPPIVLKNFAAQETVRKFGTSFSQAAFLQIAFGKGGFRSRVFCRSASNRPDADIFKTMLTIFPTIQRIMAVIIVQS